MPTFSWAPADGGRVRGTCGALTVYGARTEGTAAMTVLDRPAEKTAWYAQPADQVASQLGVDPQQGLSAEEVARRLTEYGPNEIPAEPPPSTWVVARAQLANPMNIMLLIVGVASFIIGQVATGLVVTALVTFNVIMATNQELKARASVEALAQLQVPLAWVRRSGRVEQIESKLLVPGDVVLLEAGRHCCPGPRRPSASGRGRSRGRAPGRIRSAPASRLHVVLNARREPKLPLARLLPGRAQ